MGNDSKRIFCLPAHSRMWCLPCPGADGPVSRSRQSSIATAFRIASRSRSASAAPLCILSDQPLGVDLRGRPAEPGERCLAAAGRAGASVVATAVSRFARKFLAPLIDAAVIRTPRIAALAIGVDGTLPSDQPIRYMSIPTAAIHPAMRGYAWG